MLNNLNYGEKIYLIQRLFSNVESIFNKVPVSILVNDIFMKEFFMKKLTMNFVNNINKKQDSNKKRTD